IISMNSIDKRNDEENQEETQAPGKGIKRIRALVKMVSVVNGMKKAAATAENVPGEKEEMNKTQNSFNKTQNSFNKTQNSFNKSRENFREAKPVASVNSIATENKPTVTPPPRSTSQGAKKMRSVVKLVSALKGFKTGAPDSKT